MAKPASRLRRRAISWNRRSSQITSKRSARVPATKMPCPSSQSVACYIERLEPLHVVQQPVADGAQRPGDHRGEDQDHDDGDAERDEEGEPFGKALLEPLLKRPDDGQDEQREGERGEDRTREIERRAASTMAQMTAATRTGPLLALALSVDAIRRAPGRSLSCFPCEAPGVVRWTSQAENLLVIVTRNCGSPTARAQSSLHVTRLRHDFPPAVRHRLRAPIAIFSPAATAARRSSSIPCWSGSTATFSC